MPESELRQRWAAWTLASALVATGLDGVLLQQKKAFFTGGFLASVYTRTWTEAAAFLLVLVALHFCLLLALVVVARRLVAAARLTPAARLLAVIGLASAPLIVITFVSYRLLAYLGSGFDFSLMFDLTGRQPQEILAVAARHLVGPFLLLAAAAALGTGVVWSVNRLGPGEPARDQLPRRSWLVVAGALLAGVVTMTLATLSSEAADDGLLRTASGRVFGTLARYATDVDRDGYGALGRLRDPAPFDPEIYPYAVERTGDGIDQDGVAGDLPAGTVPYSEYAPGPIVWRSRPDVVLVVLESFRADAIGRAVNGASVTPAIDALAREGISAPLAYSHNGYTAQSRFHLLSGSLTGTNDGRTLIDDFKAQGYQVAYFSGQDESFGGPEYAVGFDRADVAYDARQDRKARYSTFTTAGSLAVPATRVLDRIREFLDRRTSDQPLFLYVNYHDTHYPYHHRAIDPLVPGSPVLDEADIAPANQAALQQMYSNTAANVDRAIGETLAAVEHRLGRRPAVIVTSDHGESLFDQGFLGHGYALNDIQTRVPLIARGLPILIEQPFGQVELRAAINRALSSNTSGTLPQLTIREDKVVFQYLGTIDRPRQVALRSAHTQLVYDFRSRQVESGDAVWRDPAVIPGNVAERFTTVIHLWERMMVARQSE